MHELDPIIDQKMIQELLTLSEPGNEFFDEILLMYDQKSIELMGLIEKSIETFKSGQLDDSLLSNSHRFKGVNYNVGAIRLAGWCSRMEQACRSQEWNAIVPIWKDLSMCHQETKLMLKEIHQRVMSGN